MTTTQEAVKRLTDEQRQQMRDFQAENHRILTPADYWMGAQDSLAALSQQAAQEPQPVATVSGEVKRVNNGPGNFWNVGAILVPDGVTLEPGTKLYTAAPAKPAEQEKAPPLETPHEFALKALVAAGHVTQEKVDKALEIAGKFTAHTRQAPAGEVPFKLVDIVSDGYEGWANLIFTGPGWEGGCVAMLQPAYAEVVRAALSTPPAVPPGWKLVPVEPAPEWISNLERSSGDTCELPTEAIAECIRDLLSAAPAAPQGEQPK